jgi:hypothetical protein
MRLILNKTKEIDVAYQPARTTRMEIEDGAGTQRAFRRTVTRLLSDI